MQNFESLMFSRLLQGEGGWTHAVYVASMFAILIWRRERIVSYKLFRASYFCFAGAIVLPPILTPLMQMLAQTGTGSNSMIYTYIFAGSLAPICYAAAIVCGLASMMPERVRFASQPVGPHPLD
jgi:hypothetical protein